MTLKENQSEAIAFIKQHLPEDAERLIWEVEAIGEWYANSKVSYWQTGHHMANVFKNEAICENHIGKRIAIFKVKSWKK